MHNITYRIREGESHITNNVHTLHTNTNHFNHHEIFITIEVNLESCTCMHTAHAHIYIHTHTYTHTSITYTCVTCLHYPLKYQKIRVWWLMAVWSGKIEQKNSMNYTPCFLYKKSLFCALKEQTNQSVWPHNSLFLFNKSV